MSTAEREPTTQGAARTSGVAGPKAEARSPDDPRARAAARAAKLREHLGSLDEGEDKFYFDRGIIPDGWDYEWKRFELLGKPDKSYMVNLERRGWEPVPRSRHPEMMPDGDQGETITRDGMILMERPLETTNEVKRLDTRRAREQVRAKEEQLGAAPIGAFESNNKGAPLAKIKKTVESVPVPDT